MTSKLDKEKPSEQSQTKHEREKLYQFIYEDMDKSFQFDMIEDQISTEDCDRDSDSSDPPSNPETFNSFNSDSGGHIAKYPNTKGTKQYRETSNSSVQRESSSDRSPDRSRMYSSCSLRSGSPDRRRKKNGEIRSPKN